MRAQGPTVYQQRWDGPSGVLGECASSGGKMRGKMRGEVSATYLDYPRAAERAAGLVPLAKIIVYAPSSSNLGVVDGPYERMPYSPVRRLGNAILTRPSFAPPYMRQTSA